jgi:hypothetical protein
MLIRSCAGQLCIFEMSLLDIPLHGILSRLGILLGQFNLFATVSLNYQKPSLAQHWSLFILGEKMDKMNTGETAPLPRES